MNWYFYFSRDTLGAYGPSDVIDMVGEGFPGAAVLHWFSGSLKDLERARGCRFLFSINPAMIRSAKGRTIVGRLARREILTESDGPFVKIGPRSATPEDVMLVVEFLANLWCCSADEVRRQIPANYHRALEACSRSDSG